MFISSHIVFDESIFLFLSTSPSPSQSFESTLPMPNPSIYVHVNTKPSLAIFHRPPDTNITSNHTYHAQTVPIIYASPSLGLALVYDSQPWAIHVGLIHFGALDTLLPYMPIDSTSQHTDESTLPSQSPFSPILLDTLPLPPINLLCHSMLIPL